MTVDAVIVGAGPNGLAAAVTLARAGLSVELYERGSAVGGAAGSAELTEPGFLHDTGSAVHPMALASPFFRWFGLEERVAFVHPPIGYAHPLGDRTALAFPSLEETVSGLGTDGPAWRRLFAPLVDAGDELLSVAANRLLRIPPHPGILARFGLRALEQGSPLWNLRFREERAPAMLAGLFAHAAGRMPHPVRAGAGLLLGALQHGRGWPIPVGGSQAISDALAMDFGAHGGRIHLGTEVTDLRELPPARAVLLDLAAPHAARVAGDRLPEGYRRRLAATRFGAGIFKLDLATSAPIPWRDARTTSAGTIHLGGTRRAIAASEARIASGANGGPEPFILLSQPSLFDRSRAPAGRQTVWAYCHVPPASGIDATETVIAAIERQAPGFRDTIIAQRASTARDLELLDPNLVGGDLSGGVIDIRQTLARPRLFGSPWRMPARGLYLASSSATPGPGVHGLAGWYAAREALAREFGIDNEEEVESQ